MRIAIKILLVLLFFVSIAGASSAKVITVGEGEEYTRIGAAVEDASNGDTVFVRPGVYHIYNERIEMRSGVRLIGAGAENTTIHVNANSGGVQGVRTQNGVIYCSSLQDVEIAGFSFTSTADANDGGKGDARNLIALRNCRNVSIHDNVIHPYQYNDFVDSRGSKNVMIYNNVGTSGHDFIEFLRGSSNCRAYNNSITVRINTGIRTDGQSVGTSNIEIDHNTFTGAPGTGWCLLEAENRLSNINVHHNVFYDYKGSSGDWAVARVGAYGTYAFHDNILWDVGGVAFGQQANNTRDPAERNLSVWASRGYGYKGEGIIASPFAPINETDPAGEWNDTDVDQHMDDEGGEVCDGDEQVEQDDLANNTTETVKREDDLGMNVLKFDQNTPKTVIKKDGMEVTTWYFPDGEVLSLSKPGCSPTPFIWGVGYHMFSISDMCSISHTFNGTAGGAGDVKA